VLERPATRRAVLARERKRRSRALRARKRSLLTLDVAYEDLITALLNASDAAIRAGAPPRLTEIDSHDRGKVKVAAGEVLREWVMEWL
jgi:hypothetical protein